MVRAARPWASVGGRGLDGCGRGMKRVEWGQGEARGARARHGQCHQSQTFCRHGQCHQSPPFCRHGQCHQSQPFCENHPLGPLQRHRSPHRRPPRRGAAPKTRRAPSASETRRGPSSRPPPCPCACATRAAQRRVPTSLQARVLPRVGRGARGALVGDGVVDVAGVAARRLDGERPRHDLREHTVKTRPMTTRNLERGKDRDIEALTSFLQTTSCSPR